MKVLLLARQRKPLSVGRDGFSRWLPSTCKTTALRSCTNASVTFSSYGLACLGRAENVDWIALIGV